MPLVLNLYTAPQDVFDYMGIAGAQLRLDDENQSAGQKITATAAAATGATVVPTTALLFPVLPGTYLEFLGGGQAAVAEVVVASVARTGDTQLAVQPLASPVAQYAYAFDNGQNLVMAQRLVKGCQYGTSQVKLYCCSRYDDSDLLANAGEHGSVNRWATALASRWVGRRCCRPCPDSIVKDAEEALEEMRQVRVSMLNVEDIPTRNAGWPFISNMTLDLGYDYRKVRVEQPLSELSPTFYGQAVDWNSSLWLEY